ncbi:MAG TPA: IS21-like element helper ATPase IstB [Ktedonosporobacter sp.]|nr:IS21-like element helper ATPase IstB [Ktedonosporobacter sp.]
MPKSVSNRHDDLQHLLERLNLGGMATAFAELALKAAKEGLSHEAYLYELAQQELALRDQRRRERLLHQSWLPREKTFRTLDLDRFPPALRLQIERLKSGSFLEQAANVVAVGKPGVGKSHVLAAVGHELVQHDQAVLWTSTATLVQRLLAAKRDLRLPQELRKLDRFACVILDDIGYLQQSRDEMEVLFTFLAERYEQRSVAITTNLVFSQWDQIFKNPMTTMAALDRVVHHSVILDMMGLESYRASAAQHQQHTEEGGEASEQLPAARISATTGHAKGLPHIK